MCKVNEFSSFEILDFNPIGPIEFLKKQIIWIILNGNKFLNAQNLTSLRSNSEGICELFLRFQLSKFSLINHLSNEIKYGQKSSADLEIIGLEK